MLQIYVAVDKLQKDSRNKEHVRLVDLKRHMKALEKVISSFGEPAVEAMPVQTPTRTADLNLRANH
ncbi:hypothetical protein DVH24_003446 [Malus domestica]|uniref:Uncharacterized protein n=1 Tax=Malus domestica TaxID=3750 RepID=A0A498IH56_MALDO|nr:hypothetical protein DVH24_003446 [Malus domestica]